MTDNTPPVPPAPEHPYAGWPQPGPGQSYPSHGPNGPTPGNEPPYGPPQPYTPTGYGQQPYQQQPQYPYPPQQVPYPAQYQQPYSQPGWGVPQPPKSDLRTASGVLTIVTGAWTLLCAFSGFGGGKTALATILFLLALASLTAGILVLTLRRNRGVQVFAVTCSAVVALVSMIAPLTGFYGVVLPMTLLPLAATATVFSAVSLTRQNRTA